nr:hypothetical protein [Tanacetum cinerariifolium]
MHTTDGKVDISKALDTSLVDTKSSGTESREQDTSSRSGNDAHAEDADIKPIYDEELMAEVQFTADHNIFATRQPHAEQPEFSNEGWVDQNAEQCHDTQNEQLNKEKEHLKQTYKDLYDYIKKTRVQTKGHNDSLIEQLNKKSIENVGLNCNIEKRIKKVKKNSMDTKFAKPSILRKPVVRQPTAFKSERPRISKPRFVSQVDVKNDLSKPVTPHYLPKVREYAFVKPYHVIASSESRNSSKNMPRFSLNDMVHNHYLDEARKKNT